MNMWYKKILANVRVFFKVDNMLDYIDYLFVRITLLSALAFLAPTITETNSIRLFFYGAFEVISRELKLN